MTTHVPRRRPVVLAALALVVALLGPGAWSAASAAQPPCTPGSGVDLSGQRVTAEQAGVQDDLRCANLTNADLSRLDLTQADLSGVLASGASFADAKLVQTEMAGADLSGADLSGATLTQAEMPGATLTAADLSDTDAGQVDLSEAILRDADLSGARLTQADLRKADLTGADVSDAELTQAHLRGATLDGLKGLPQWGLWVTIGCAVLLVLLVASAVWRAFRSSSATFADSAPTGGRAAAFGGAGQASWAPGGYGPVTMPAGASGAVTTATPSSTWSTPNASGVVPPMAGIAPTPSTPNDRSVAVKIAWGVAGSIIAVLGVHLFVGGMLGSVGGAFNPLLTESSGPLAVVGVGAGVLGTIVGIPLALFGLFVRSNCD